MTAFQYIPPQHKQIFKIGEVALVRSGNDDQDLLT